LKVFKSLALFVSLSAAADADYSQNGDDWTGICATGSTQSPVIIPHAVANTPTADMIAASKGRLIVGYARPTDPEVFSVTYKQNEIDIVPVMTEGATFRHTMGVGDKVYNLIDIHLHAAAEHPISTADSTTDVGSRGAGEIHFVYANEASQPQLVIGYILETDASLTTNNDFFKAMQLEKLYAEGATVEGAHEVTVTLPAGGPNQLVKSAEFAANKETFPFITYPGSLTTPPCTEGITFYLARASISTEDAKALAQLTANAEGKGTYRNAQPLNGREFSVFQMELPTATADGATSLISVSLAASVLIAVFA
jgi:carbonic anhydrase